MTRSLHLTLQQSLGLGAGFFAVCIGSPVDVVKSRIMGNDAQSSCDHIQSPCD